MVSLSRRSLAVAVGVSLAAHGLLVGLGLYAPAEAAPRPMHFDNVVYDDKGCEITFEFPEPPSPKKPPGPRDAPSWEAKVVDPPPLAPPVAPALYPTPTEDMSPTLVAPGVGQSNPGPPGNGSGVGAAAPQVKLFQVAAPCQSVVFVLDCSISMGLHGGFETARREVLASVARLPAGTRFQVIPYTRAARPLASERPDGYLVPDPETLRRVTDTLQAIRPSDGTAHIIALQCALRLRPEVIFFVTDADELRMQEVNDIVRQANGRTVVHTIELSATPTGQWSSPLGQLAQQTHGLYRNVLPAE